MRVRLMGVPDECVMVLGVLRERLAVTRVDGPYRCREAGWLRYYVETADSAPGDQEAPRPVRRECEGGAWCRCPTSTPCYPSRGVAR